MRECIAIAALCHDIGHGAFSHLSERLIQKEYDCDFSHEEISNQFVRELVRRYNVEADGYITEGDLDFILTCIDPKFIAMELERDRHSVDTRYLYSAYIYQIVSDFVSGADVDRLDYFIRDARNCKIDIPFSEDEFYKNIQIREGCGWYFLCHDEDFIERFLGTRVLLFNSIYNEINVIATSLCTEDMLSKYLGDEDNTAKKFSLAHDSKEFLEFYCKLTDTALMENPIFYNLSKCKLIVTGRKACRPLHPIDNEFYGYPMVFREYFQGEYYPCRSYLLDRTPSKRTLDMFENRIPEKYQGLTVIVKKIKPSVDRDSLMMIYRSDTCDRIMARQLIKMFVIFKNGRRYSYHDLGLAADLALSSVIKNVEIANESVKTGEVSREDGRVTGAMQGLIDLARRMFIGNLNDE
jgi:hypothetical protein